MHYLLLLLVLALTAFPTHTQEIDFDTNKMWVDKQPYKRLANDRVLSYTNSYGVELISTDIVMTDKEFVTFLKGSKNSFGDTYRWYFKNIELLDTEFQSNALVYLMDDFFYNYIRDYVYENASIIDKVINKNSLIPIDTKDFLKDFPSVQTLGIEKTLKNYLSSKAEAPPKIRTYGLPRYFEEEQNIGEEQNLWPFTSSVELRVLFERAVTLASLIHGISLDYRLYDYMEYGDSRSYFPNYKFWLENNLHRMTFPSQGSYIFGLSYEDRQASPKISQELGAYSDERHKNYQNTYLMKRNMLHNFLLLYMLEFNYR